MDRVIIIGNGLAGISAAVHCANQGLRVVLVSPFPPERSQSVMAMGGIAAALDHKHDGDSPERHFEDTVKGGVYLADPNAVRGMVNGAPEIVYELERYGALFSRTAEGEIDQRPFGGHSRQRAAFCGAQTGKQLLSALILQLRKLESTNRIVQMYGYRMLSIVTDDNDRCTGCVLMDAYTHNLLHLTCSRLIMASGGLNGVYGNAVGSTANDAGATAALFAQGVRLANLEFVQFHPTTVQTPAKRMLISEAARGDGGRLFAMRDGKPWYFMEEAYPEKGNLMPRDVVSREIYKVCDKMGLGVDGGNAVLLDIRHLGEEAIRTRLDEVYFICTTYLNLDPVREPIPVYPGVHFFMGGIKVDTHHLSNVENLYAAGECACQYHGANRLGANSLLGAVYGGKTAAIHACAGTHDIPASAKRQCEQREEQLAAEMDSLVRTGGLSNRELRLRIHSAANKALSIARDGNGLQAGLAEMDDMMGNMDRQGIHALIPYEAWLTQKTAILARAMMESALHRTESRGAHMRLDYPETDEAQRKTSVAQCSGNGIQIGYEDIPGRLE